MSTDDDKKPPISALDQEAVISFLKNQLTDGADHIRTHCAHIFLIGDIVYKLKSAVKYSYLDMSTLEKRKKLCDREYQLNASILPDIYIGVVPITLDEKHHLSIDGTGTIVEWALKMSRFAEENILDNIALRGELTTAMARNMGRSLAKYHADLPSQPATDGYLRIKEVYEELVLELSLLEQVFTIELLEEFKTKGQKALEESHYSLDQRARNGLIKRCHGDLHLRNILMTSYGPRPFDALEFDERMATTDVLYDIAFLLMDMIHRGMREQANALLNTYLLHSDPTQCSGMRPLPLFLCLRAAIRAMTTAQAAKQQAEDLHSLNLQAKHYLKDAIAYLQDSAPRMIAIGGLSGTGKSSVANAIAGDLGCPVGAVLLRSDSERKVLAGVNETERLPDTHYTQENSRKVYQHLFNKARMALESGATVILDAVFHDVEVRVQAQEIARKANVPFHGLWLEAPFDILKERINQRQADASDADAWVLKNQMLKATGFLKWVHVDASGSLTQTIKNVTDELESSH